MACLAGRGAKRGSGGGPPVRLELLESFGLVRRRPLALPESGPPVFGLDSRGGGAPGAGRNLP